MIDVPPTPSTTGAAPRIEDQADKSGLPWSKIAIGVVVLAGLVALAREAGGYVPRLAEWVEAQGAWGPVAFIVVYVAAVVLLIPGALLTLAGGAIFGVVEGTIYVFIAATLGSAAAFLVARHLARGLVEKHFGGGERFDAIDHAVGEHGLKIVFLMRLSPIFPFSYMNFALGLTRVHFRDYVLASVGMLPGTLLYVYYGQAIGDVAAIAGGATQETSTADYVIRFVGLAATIAVTAIVTRIARRALDQATDESPVDAPREPVES